MDGRIVFHILDSMDVRMHTKKSWVYFRMHLIFGACLPDGKMLFQSLVTSTQGLVCTR